MDELTNQGVQALKEGDKVKARTLFFAALEKDADNAQAWLWLSGAVDNEQDRLDCLEQVLRIDPSNEAAGKGVALLRGTGPLSTAGSTSEPQPASSSDFSNLSMPVHPDIEPVPAAAGEEPAPAETSEVSAPIETGEEPSPAEASEAVPAAEPGLPPAEAPEEMFPSWMAALTPEDATLAPAAAPAPEAAAPAAAPLAEAASMPSAEVAPVQATTPVEVVPPVVVAKLEEKTLFKLQPSLVTPVVVYGIGSVILFVATMGLLLTITNSDSPLVLIGLILVVCLLLALLALLVLETLGHLVTSYTFTNRRLYVEKGVVKRSRQSIPIRTIKSVTLKQGLLQKLVGIGNLTVHADGSGGKEELTQLIDISKAAQALKRIDTARTDRS